ncbi:DUSAM domain-containing protein [Stigmatella aurantiaca]|uniref:DUSAM domain-containing protein n=1 Tax=Stigmatella aurantiaca TaxID=41 RepID=UPI0009427EC0|nr:DUSAM domain-containing protein [Stigmatella aurantiaca]
MHTRPNWDEIRDLSRRVLREGAPLVLTEEVRALLLRTAQEVAISGAEVALCNDTSTLALLRECARRITEGSNRLMDAVHRMYRYQDAGDFERARQEMRDVLAVEVVPYYRETAQGQLDDMADD